MRILLKHASLLLLASLAVSACSSPPPAKRDPYNDADAQRSRASQTQDELSSERHR